VPEWSPESANDPKAPVMIIDVRSRVEKAVNDKRYELLDQLMKKN
jgi:hypothetical protein